MSEANHIMSDHVSRLKTLEEENVALKAQLDDWKGNAEGFEPDAYMELPRDEDGVPIRIGDEVSVDGDAMTVLGYRLHDDMLLLVTKDKESGLFFTPEPSRVRHFKPEPADSWEKLEGDAMKSTCELGGNGGAGCDECRFGPPPLGCEELSRLEILKRAKKLAGIEEEAQ